MHSFLLLFMSNPVSRVLSFKTVIYLRRVSLHGSSRPSDYRSDKPILSALLRMGFTWHKALPQCRWALTPPFHPYRYKIGGLFLLHFPQSRLHRDFSGILSCEARTFLISTNVLPRPFGLLRWLFYHIILSVSSRGETSVWLINNSNLSPNFSFSLFLRISVTIFSLSK